MHAAPRYPPPAAAALVAAVLAVAAAHSQMSDPESTAPMTCRMGGEPQFGVDNCPGPCDLRAIKGGYANHGDPSNPAATYGRGEKVTIKYQRNNHGPGGFVRLTLVKPSDMMDKAAHRRNAFYYTCWGANPRRAAQSELGRDRFGFGLIGSDAEQHDFAPGYYTFDVTIPPVVADGDYVLGWVWYGGCGSSIESEQQQEPKPWGYFGDYWSCSYVRIQGGAALQREHVPVFNNDMTRWSSEGCMSANDAPGVCTNEPCKVTAEYQKPREFKNGKVPAALTPEHFGGVSPGGGEGTSAPSTTRSSTTSGAATTATTMTTTSGQGGPPSDEVTQRRKACKCIAVGTRCWRMLAERSGGRCERGKTGWGQSDACKQACCELCTESRGNRFCQTDIVKRICDL